MTRMRRWLLPLAGPALLLVCCALEREAPEPAAVEEAAGAVGYASQAARAPAPPPEPSPGPPASGEQAAAPVPRGPRRLIRTVDLDLRVEDPEAVAARLQALTTSSGGYVASSDAFREAGRLHFRLTLKVPGDRLEAVLGEVRRLAAEVEREQLRTADVTAQYIDLEARLRTLRSTETELRALLAESRSRGHKAEDIMAIYRQLLEIRTGVEQAQGQLAALSESTTYSTVNVTLRPTEAATPLAAEEWSPLDTLRRSARGLVRALQGLADLAIYVLVVVAPVLLLVAFPIWLLLRVLRRARRRRAASTGPPG